MSDPLFGGRFPVREHEWIKVNSPTGGGKFQRWLKQRGQENWIDVTMEQEEKRWMLVEKDPAHEVPDKDHYCSPFEDHTGLFLTFGELDFSREQIRSFADEYGLLSPETSLVKCSGEGSTDGEESRRGDHYLLWKSHLKQMKMAIVLWKALEGKQGQLSDYIQWENDDVYLIFRNQERDGFTHKQKISEQSMHVNSSIQGIERGNLELPAKIALRKIMNDNLGEDIAPRMGLSDGLEPMTLKFSPGSLITSLWLQLGKAITQDNEYRDCRQCGEWFELHPDTNRTNRKFCSNACRSKNYRKRKKKAQKMFKRGDSVEEIAEKLITDTEPEKIRGWVQDH